MKASYKKYGIGGVAQSYSSPMIESGMQTVTGNWGGSPVSVFANGGMSKDLSIYVNNLRSKPYEYEKVSGMSTLNMLEKNGLIEFTEETGKDRMSAGSMDKINWGERPHKIQPRNIESAISPTFKFRGKEYFIGYEKGINFLKFYVLKKGESWEKYNSPSKMADGGDVGKMALGGYTKRYKSEDMYRIREKKTHERMKTEGVGNFELPKDRNTRYLYELDEADMDLIKEAKIKLSPNEHIFRMESETTKVGKMTPLVKLNLENQLVYFLTEKAMEDGEIKFSTRGVKAKFINISDKYADGGKMADGGFVGDVAGSDLTPTMMGGGMGNAQDAILKNGGQAEVKIENKDLQFNKKLYKGVLDDFDLDGLPNADDPNPLEKKDSRSIEQTKLSTALNNVIRVKDKMDVELDEFVSKLRKVAPNDSKIYGRTKTPYSILNKLVNSRLLDEKRGLKDLVGTTVALNSFDDLTKFKKRVEKGVFGKVVDFDDYYEKPNDGYRAYHFIVEQNGTPIELQLNTDRMKQINVLSHDAYKNKVLDRDYLLYLTTIANEADKGNKSSQNEYEMIMRDRVSVKKKLSSGQSK